jgi:hypothetical protein
MIHTLKRVLNCGPQAKKKCLEDNLKRKLTDLEKDFNGGEIEHWP